jgi:hypothetical protein
MWQVKSDMKKTGVGQRIFLLPTEAKQSTTQRIALECSTVVLM